MTIIKRSNTNAVPLKSFSKFYLIFTLIIFMPISSCTEKDETNSERDSLSMRTDTIVVVDREVDTLEEEVIVENHISKANKIIAQLDSTTSLDKKIIEIQKEIYPDPALLDDLYSGSQTDMNLGQEQQYINKKKLLAKIIEIIKEDYKTNDWQRESRGENFIANLDKSQDLWYKYMNAQALVKYPDDEEIHYGSSFNLCYFSYLIELTDQRIETLNAWLIGELQGDVCSGTIENKRSRN